MKPRLASLLPVFVLCLGGNAEAFHIHIKPPHLHIHAPPIPHPIFKGHPANALKVHIRVPFKAIERDVRDDFHKTRMKVHEVIHEAVPVFHEVLPTAICVGAAAAVASAGAPPAAGATAMTCEALISKKKPGADGREVYTFEQEGLEAVEKDPTFDEEFEAEDGANGCRAAAIESCEGSALETCKHYLGADAPADKLASCEAAAHNACVSVVQPTCEQYVAALPP